MARPKEISRWTPAQRRKCREIAWARIKHIESAPCVVCGSDQTQMHHEDYDRPLEVIFYCREHHTARHVEIRHQARAALRFAADAARV